MALLVAGALASIVLLAAARKPTDSVRATFSAKEVRVQVALYSGLPNPKWTLQAAQLGECLKILSELSAFKSPEPPSGLGYGGLRLELVQANGVEVGFRIHDGGVWMEDEISVAYEDKRRDLERWLIATAPPDVRQLMPANLVDE